jgi:hypothetical protein
MAKDDKQEEEHTHIQSEAKDEGKEENSGSGGLLSMIGDPAGASLPFPPHRPIPSNSIPQAKSSAQPSAPSARPSKKASQAPSATPSAAPRAAS